jgi:DNA-binding MarR family transcriptional regulator
VAILHFDEGISLFYSPDVMQRDVRILQSCYPQIYLACHTRHARRRSASAGISASDSSLLAHLDELQPMRPGALARHLGIGQPALSASIKRLVSLGLIHATAAPSDARLRHLRLTSKGALAMRQHSVLEASRVEALLKRLEPSHRRAAIDGIELLARAARQMTGAPRRD